MDSVSIHLKKKTKNKNKNNTYIKRDTYIIYIHIRYLLKDIRFMISLYRVPVHRGSFHGMLCPSSFGHGQCGKECLWAGTLYKQGERN